MIIVLLSQTGGAVQTMLALHLAGARASQGRRNTVVDATPRGTAPDWPAQRAEKTMPRPFGVIGRTRDTLHREPPKLRARSKVTAFERGQAVADMLRDLLARGFPAAEGEQT